MKVNVLLFATLKDIAGTNRVVIELPGEQVSVADVKQALKSRFPEMTDNIDAAIAAVNEEYAFTDDIVHTGDQVAFFPPVSGGSSDDHPTIVYLATEPIDHDDLIQSVTTPATGAVVVFSGMVRGETRKEGGVLETAYLHYEAYETMAISKMQKVAAEIRNQWPLVQGVAIVQRIGKLEVGQNTILIACSAGHRNDGCFEAARYGIDRLKEIVPVWKKEFGQDGSSWVEGSYIPNSSDRSNRS